MTRAQGWLIFAVLLTISFWVQTAFWCLTDIRQGIKDLKPTVTATQEAR